MEPADPLSHGADVELLRDTMTPPAFEELVHELAEAIRDARSERDGKRGPGNRALSLEFEIARGEFASAWWQPPKRQIRKRRSA